MLKGQPLQTITFQWQILDRDLSGGRKRKLPNDTLSTCSSKPVKEPLISVSDFDNLAADLNKSKCHSTLLLAIKAGKKAVNSGLNSSAIIEQHYNLLAEKKMLTPKQGSNEWYRQRVGKITSSKLPTLTIRTNKCLTCLPVSVANELHARCDHHNFIVVSL